MEKIIHIVHFQFYDTATPEEIKGVCECFVGLKENCIHPTTQKPYILSTTGGKDNSPEGLQGIFTHSYILEFASKEDRDYYISHDPAHMAFGHSLTGIVQKVMVMDFVPGVY
ncbi:hypothetical protein B7463_g794, partial [Scytalidium lignicola]